ncbi:syndecan-4-like isoform X1 [Xiphophorus maculatus]|uniref:syndecan-4-like isoform X1 n=1 Tax=Xiphophorus maculatus TaxID=8083 RepID=UPI0006D91B6D|nr:syndecan-4-like isoform X1 [Xiphophorus maculatus]
MIFPLCLVLMLSASVLSESQVRETETWMPMSTTQTVAMSTDGGDLEASGDSSNGSDFGFIDDEDDDYYDEDDVSGSGEGETESRPSAKPDFDNRIPDLPDPARPKDSEIDLVKNRNEIPPLGSEPETKEENPSNVLMSQAKGDSIFNKTEVLAAVIAGCAVCLMFAVLLILLLIYRMKKKDEGSYDLGKKPIYKKAPTTEIYA